MIYNLKALFEIRRDRKKSESEIRELQKKRLKDLLVHLSDHVPFYQDHFKKIMYNPKRDFAGIEDLKLLPIITKSEIRRLGVENFLSSAYNKDKLVTDHSSGSTGEPFRVYRNNKYHAYQLANFFAVLIENGYKFTDKILSFSSPARLKTGRSILRHFGILRRLAVDYNASPEKALDIVLKYQPSVMFGNPSSFDLLSLEMKKQNIKIDFVKLILAGGTSIAEGSQQLTEDRFGIRMTEFYGSIEFGILAYKKTAKDFFSLCQNQTIYEFLDKEDNDMKEGEKGRLILTSLFSEAFPFIRYDVGDFASFRNYTDRFGENSVGIDKIFGRTNDVVELKNGKVIAYQHFHSIMNLHTEIYQFKILQKTEDHFDIIIAVDKEYYNTISEKINAKLKNLFGDSANFKIHIVDKIDNEKGGKIKTFETLNKRDDN